MFLDYFANRFVVSFLDCVFFEQVFFPIFLFGCDILYMFLCLFIWFFARLVFGKSFVVLVCVFYKESGFFGVPTPCFLVESVSRSGFFVITMLCMYYIVILILQCYIL